MLNSLTEHFFTINQCYKFITILEVLTDQTKTKSIKLKFFFFSQGHNCQLPLRFSEIRATVCQNSQETEADNTKILKIENFRISGHQILTEVETHLGRNNGKATIMKSLLKVINPCSLGVNQFCGAGNSSKYTRKSYNRFHPPLPTKTTGPQ